MTRFLTLIVLLVCSCMAAQNWHQDFERATALAAKNNTPVLLVFSGSDWCAPCIKLDKKIWQSDSFKKYAKDHLVLFKADFPRKKANRLSEELMKQNKDLADKYNPQGYFPFILLIDKNGKQISVVEQSRKDMPDDIIYRIKNSLN
jgi:thioredoxin-related protein